MNNYQRVFAMSFAKVYPLLVAKAEKKGRTKDEVDTVIRWLTGYTPKGLEKQLKQEATMETFFRDAPKPNPRRHLITGTICGVRVEEIDDPLMREIRYLDKLIDELAKGRPMEKVLRSEPAQPAGEPNQQAKMPGNQQLKPPGNPSAKTPGKPTRQSNEKSRAGKVTRRRSS
ncbi:MAG: DUF2200 domain-containing protein [Gemmataceae bacterium]|nr:DUF2200 domain-containing protein [Gemmataceae bacterium]